METAAASGIRLRIDAWALKALNALSDIQGTTI
jgi:hypothetical protein